MYITKMEPRPCESLTEQGFGQLGEKFWQLAVWVGLRQWTFAQSTKASTDGKYDGEEERLLLLHLLYVPALPGVEKGQEWMTTMQEPA